MALKKQPVQINFSQGVDTKTDPWQVSIGKMLSLQNCIFTKAGMLQKRNGFSSLSSLLNSESTSLTTFSGSLVSIGETFQVLSQDTMSWYDKGSIHPLDISVQSLVRKSNSIINCDVSVASTGLSCTAFTDSDGNSYYQICDSNNGQIIVEMTALPSSAVNARVFTLGRYFIITFLISIFGTPHLQYIAIPLLSPNNPGTATDLSTTINTINEPYDGIVTNNSLYISYNASDLSTAIRTFYLDSNLNQSSTQVLPFMSADLMSVTSDNSGPSPVIYVSLWRQSDNTLYTFAYSPILNLILGQTPLVTSSSIVSLVSIANESVVTIFYQSSNTYSGTSIRSDFVSKITCTSPSGTVVGPEIILRGVGLASKPFLNQGIYYLMVVYGGSFQPTYFLIDENGAICSKISYSNALGYSRTQILPQSNVNNDLIQIGYLIQDQLVSVNKSQGVTQGSNIYSQLGVNLLSFSFSPPGIKSSEIAEVIHLSGGFLWMYDGNKPIEHGFHLWPEDLTSQIHTSGGGLKAQQYFYQATYEWTDAQGNLHRSAPSIPLSVDLSNVSPTPVTFTGSFSTGDTQISCNDVTGLILGQVITDTTTGSNLSPNTKIIGINSASKTITISLPAAGNSGVGGDSLQTDDTLSVNIQIPTLRETLKTGNNPVRIVIYRWSTDQQIYYQITPIQSPLNNSTTIDSVTYLDTFNDFQILGNVIIYTTGGVVENIGAPSVSTMTLFKSRLFLIDAEDRNLIWFSKQVIESTPVETSDLFTLYVAPTISAQGSTGPTYCLAPMDDKLICFKQDAIYYITGNGPDNTGSNNDFSDPIFINSTVGSTNQNSIVFIPQGLMFQSDKGIWLLGRDLSTTYIGAMVEKYNSNEVLSAINIPNENQVRFTLNNGVTLMYDYYYGQWGTFTNIPAISSTLYEGLHTYLNSFGQVFQETPGLYLDGSNPVLMSFQTSWFNLLGLQGYQRAYFCFFLGNYITPHQLSVQVAYDYESTAYQSSLIQPKNYNPAYGGDALYGSGSPYGGNSSVEKERLFFEKGKCESIQLTVSEIYDPSFGVPAGEGLTLSGINLVIGAKLVYPKFNPSLSTG